MNRRLIVLAAALTVSPCALAQAPIIYGAEAYVTRDSSQGARDDSLVTVGAQVNAYNASGVNQIAFGIATEAWALPGSHSRLVGIEASNINEEPDNAMRKIGVWSTFKNRPDYAYADATRPAGNLDSQAVRIESEPGTGWERGIVFGRDSLRRSGANAATVIDYSEVPMEKFTTWALVRYPDGWCEYYAGQGQKVTRRCDP